MNRREVITLIGGAATWPLAARAQQAMPVVGIVRPGADYSASNNEAVLKGLAEYGFVEGQTMAIEYRFAKDEFDRLPALIAGLLDTRVSVIAAIGTANTAQAAKAATTTVPIVFVNGSDPVKSGLVASMNRPGGNVTGVTFLSGQLSAKRLDLMLELMPQAALIGFLVNPENSRASAEIAEMQAAANGLGRQIIVVPARSAAEIDAAFATIAQRKAQAVIVAGDGTFNSRREQMAALAARYRLPASYPARDYVEAGGLMGYGDDRRESLRQAGRYVGRILKGEKPVDLPVLQPTKFELVINLKTARALGLDIPSKLLALADEVIE